MIVPWVCTFSVCASSLTTNVPCADAWFAGKLSFFAPFLPAAPVGTHLNVPRVFLDCVRVDVQGVARHILEGGPSPGRATNMQVQQTVEVKASTVPRQRAPAGCSWLLEAT